MIEGKREQRGGYTIPRPTYPIAARVLTGVVVAALLGLGLVAFEVFSLIDNPAVAAAFAVVIELGAIAEALSILRKNKPAYAGLVISILVSGLYNYTRGAQAAARLAAPLSQVELVALAVGPLSATLFLALALGHEVAAYEQRLATWELNRQAWLDQREQAREAAERERDEAERAYQLQLSRIATEEKARVQLAQAESAREVELARLRAQERESKRATRVQLAQLAQSESAHAQGLHNPDEPAGAGERGSYDDFVRESRTRNGAGPMHASEIMVRYGVSRRTAYNWLGRYESDPAPDMDIFPPLEH